LQVGAGGKARDVGGEVGLRAGPRRQQAAVFEAFDGGPGLANRGRAGGRPPASYAGAAAEVQSPDRRRRARPG